MSWLTTAVRWSRSRVASTSWALRSSSRRAAPVACSWSCEASRRIASTTNAAAARLEQLGQVEGDGERLLVQRDQAHLGEVGHRRHDGPALDALGAAPLRHAPDRQAHGEAVEDHDRGDAGVVEPVPPRVIVGSRSGASETSIAKSSVRTAAAHHESVTRMPRPEERDPPLQRHRPGRQGQADERRRDHVPRHPEPLEAVGVGRERGVGPEDARQGDGDQDRHPGGPEVGPGEREEPR